MIMRGANILLLSLLLCSSIHLALSFTDGLIKNENFEIPPKKSDIKGTVILKDDAIPEWKLSGFIEYITAGQKQGDMLLIVPEGYAALRLGNELSMKQRVNVTIGMYYSITFSAARTCAQEETLNVSVSPDFGVLPMQTLYSSNGWDSYGWDSNDEVPGAVRCGCKLMETLFIRNLILRIFLFT